jgi:predicted HicB family RNase H-like nuclease
MTKSEKIWVRLDPAVKVALELAALADHRSVSSLAAKIIAEWLATLTPAPRGSGAETSDD